MDTSALMFGSIVGLIIWAAILDAIIRDASKSKKIELQLKMQTQLLAKMAQKQGVPDEEINGIINMQK